MHVPELDLRKAAEHLAERDPKLAIWIERIGPLEQDFAQPFDTLDALARSIVYQQLSGKAAATIHGRLMARVGRDRLCADDIDALADEEIRACGLSTGKTRALRDLAEKSRQGQIPAAPALALMDNERIIETLSAVRGIGRWTVEMLLIFRLGRADVLPLNDLGVQKGAQRVHRTRKLPDPARLTQLGKRWAPYRSAASLYLWRVADLATNPPG